MPVYDIDKSGFPLDSHHPNIVHDLSRKGSKWYQAEKSNSLSNCVDAKGNP